MGGGKQSRLKSISLILASSLALSCTFFSCANASGGGSGNPNGSDNPTTEKNNTQTLSSARWSCATSEEETAIGNKVSEVLCLFDDNKFELRKNISYSDGNDSISFFQTFYKGTYTGGIRDGMKFDITEELDTKDFDEEMNQVFNLESAETQSTQPASDAASRSVIPATRTVSSNIVAILAACQEKLKSAKFKKVADKKSMSLETNGSSIELKGADGKTEKFEEKSVDKYINLDGFLFTGNPCQTRVNTSNWHWANTEDEGARVLEKTADGKWTCKFRADGDDTLIRIIWNDWAADWGLSAIDKENSTLPNGAGITDDSHAVNNEEGFEKYQDPRNIAITGLEAKRKYDITFDTKKSPGKICIELAEHKISTLDGWLLSGTPVEMKVSKYKHGGTWPMNYADGAAPLKKVGNTWQVSFTVKKGWNGFRIIRENWIDEIGWSSFDWKNRFDEYNGLRGDSDRYALEDEDTVSFQDVNFDGTEKITLTFGLNNGRITCKTDIQYTKEFDLDIYTNYAILETEPREEDHWYNLASGDISDKSFSFSISKSSGILSIQESVVKDENGNDNFQLADCQRLESVELPNGVNWSLHDYWWGILLTGLVPEKTYNVQLKKGSKTGYFKIIITEQ